LPVTTNTLIPVTFIWNFGDGAATSANQFPAHTYASPGSYIWSVAASVSGATATRGGTIVIGNPVSLAINNEGNTATISWPNTIADTLLEASGSLDASSPWLWVTNAPTASGSLRNVTLPVAGDQFFRVRRPW
jgi:PKD repeat protein